MNVLAFDTAGPVVGVGLWCAGTSSRRIERVQRGAEARLIPWASALCAEAGIRLDQLDGIAVSSGPGAFTGVRVGIATAAGLALGLKCPLWTASSLDARAERAGVAGSVLALLDARKGRVYAALYREGQRVEGPADVAPTAAVGWVLGPFVATGEGAVVYASAVRDAGGTVAAEAADPAVEILARMGAEGLARGEGIDPAGVQPVYLRAPDAVKPTR